MPGKKKKRRAPLAEGPKACMQALRSLASLGVASGDSHAALRSPNLWPHEVHDDITAAWKALSANGEMPAHVASATLETLRGLPLVPGFKVRLPTAPDKDTHPTFIKGSGRNPAFLKLRDFTDSLVMATEATLARDATSAPLAKGKAKMPEQRALRQHLGVPAGPAAGKAQVSAADLRALFGDAGVNLAAERVAHLTAVVGGSCSNELVEVTMRALSAEAAHLPAQSRKLPGGLPLKSIKMIAAQLFKLEPTKMQLLYTPPGQEKDIPEELDDDSKGLADLGVVSGGTIVIDELQQ